MNEEAMTPDKEQVVEPLSAAEEAIARRTHRPASRTVPFIWVESGEKDERVETSCARCEEEWPCGASRLLATLDAARTASVAGLDRERLATLADRIDTFCSACEGDRYLVTADPEDDGQPGDPYQVQCLDSIHACADMVRAAPSIEQEPGAWNQRAALEADRNPQETER